MDNVEKLAQFLESLTPAQLLSLKTLLVSGGLDDADEMLVQIEESQINKRPKQKFRETGGRLLMAG
jgi:hypothetical protein